MATTKRAIESRNRKAEAITIEYGQSDKPAASRMHRVILLATIATLGCTMATHAIAGVHMGGAQSGPHAAPMSRSFSAPMIDQPLSTPTPQFNPSESYTVPQSSEVPVSPASPGSVFGHD